MLEFDLAQAAERVPDLESLYSLSGEIYRKLFYVVAEARIIYQLDKEIRLMAGKRSACGCTVSGTITTRSTI